MQHYTTSDIANLLGVDVATVKRYCSAFRAVLSNGAASPPAGRGRILSENDKITLQELHAILRSPTRPSYAMALAQYQERLALNRPAPIVVWTEQPSIALARLEEHKQAHLQHMLIPPSIHQDEHINDTQSISSHPEPLPQSQGIVWQQQSQARRGAYILLRQKHQALRTRYQTLKQDSIRQTDDCATLATENADLQRHNTQYLETIAGLQQQLEQVQSRQMQIQTAYLTALDVVVDFQQHITSLKTFCQELLEAYTVALQTIETLQQQIRLSTDKHEHQFRRHQNRIQEQAQKLLEFSRDIGDLHDDLEGCRRYIHELESQLAMNGTTIQEQNLCMRYLIAAYTALRNEYASLYRTPGKAPPPPWETLLAVSLIPDEQNAHAIALQDPEISVTAASHDRMLPQV